MTAKTPTRPEIVPEIVSEIATLCRTRGLEDLADTAESALDRERRPWMLVTGTDALQSTPAAERVRTAAPGTVTEISLHELVGTPSRSLSADRLVVLLACGELLSADALEALTLALDDRPEGSYAVVYHDPGLLDDADDLELFERGARRWVADDQDGATLCEQGVYLTGDLADADRGFLEERLRTDLCAFEEWLRSAPPQLDKLERWRLFQLLNRTEAALVATPAPPHRTEGRGDAAAVDKELSRVCRELARGRDLLPARVTSDLGLLERELVNDLGRIVAKAIADLRKLLDEEVPTVPTRTTSRELERAVEQRLSLAGEIWRDQAADRIDAAQEQMALDLRTLFSAVDWSLVARTTATTEGRYPDLWLERIDGELARELAPAVDPDLLSVPRERPSMETQQGRVVLFSTAAAIVSATVLFALKIRFPWLPLVSASAAVGTGWLGMSGLRQETARTAASQMEEALYRDLEEAERTIRDRVECARLALLQPLTEEVEELETALREARPAETTDAETVAASPAGGLHESSDGSLNDSLDAVRALRRRAQHAHVA